MIIQLQITGSDIVPNKFVVVDYPDERLSGVADLPGLLQALGSKFGKIIVEEIETGIDNPETIG